MRPYDPDQPVIFVHIPKCAGTSFIRLLRKWYGPGYHHPHVDESDPSTTLPSIQLKREDGSWNPEVQCIHAHFDHGRGYGLPDQMPEVEQYFSFIRDPFDIVVSMYFFAKGKSARGEFLYQGKRIDIREQYRSVRDYVNEHPAWLYNHLPQDIKLDNIESKIEERFVYLGLFEDMEGSLNQLARVLGKPQVPLPRHNAANYDESIPDTLREQFYEQHPLLKAVHDYAKQHYQDPIRVADGYVPTKDRSAELSPPRPRHPLLRGLGVVTNWLSPPGRNG